MRPTRLELKGFTAFREKCEIDFSGFDLFAITGQTGAGKTSLLDAMTYALYGKTSRLNRAGRDLISQGANALSVLLSFRAGSDEYRVLRAIRGSTVTARLERMEAGEWKPVTGTLGEVNEQVEKIVGLDFDGFTKAVILPQGKFDVFLRGKPDERREVLNDLLDVRVYQRMMQSSNEKSRMAAERRKTKEAEIVAAATPASKAEKERELEGLVTQEKSFAALIERLRGALPEALGLREKRESLSALERELAEIEAKIALATAAATRAEQDADRQRELIEEVDRQIRATAYDGDLHLRLTQLEQPALQRQKLTKQVADLDRKRTDEVARLTDADRRWTESRAVLDEVAGRLQEAEDLRQSKKAAADELRSRHGSPDAIQQAVKDFEKTRLDATDIAKIQEAIAQLEARVDSVRGEVEAAEKAVSDAESRLEEAEQIHEQLVARNRVAAIRLELKAGEACPVCEQKVMKLPAAADAKELERTADRVKQAKFSLKKGQDGLRAVQNESAGLPGKIDLAQQQMKVRESAIAVATERASRVLGRPADKRAPAALRLLIDQIQMADMAAQHAQSNYEELLGSERDAAESHQANGHKRQMISTQIDNLRKQVEGCRGELASLEGALKDAPPLEEITARLKTLRAARLRRDELEAARKQNERALKTAEDAALRGAKDSEAQEQAKVRCVQSHDELSDQISASERHLRQKLGDFELSGGAEEAAQIERALGVRQKEFDGARERVQECQFAIHSLSEKIANNERLAAEMKQEEADEALYRELGVWLNAGNFQQHLLTSAFELLAREGSKHLKILSNDRYTFGYRDKEFEVIDKWHGEARSVNTLSGGESFLASLALALALAESIAELNAAGGVVALESLFLDEGFSTLDGETLSNVADAIQLLQNGKRLVGIITHVQSLADQMPARIEIEKTLAGSRIVGAPATNAAGRS